MAGKRSTNLKATAATAIDDCKVELQELGSQIRENSEIGIEEVKAHKILTRLVLYTCSPNQGADRLASFPDSTPKLFIAPSSFLSHRV